VPADVAKFKPIPRTSKGKKPRYLETLGEDLLLQMVLIQAEEIAVLRERLDTVLRLGETGQTISEASLEAYRPNEAVAQARETWRNAFNARLFQPWTDEIARASGDRGGETEE
jgi:hypothetical protein